eukprot:9324806-Alexandrium_andersonii.AAC.1
MARCPWRTQPTRLCPLAMWTRWQAIGACMDETPNHPHPYADAPSAATLLYLAIACSAYFPATGAIYRTSIGSISNKCSSMLIPETSNCTNRIRPAIGSRCQIPIQR